jgi:predicted esterase
VRIVRAIAAAAAVTIGVSGSAPDSTDAAFEAFFRAGNPGAAEKIAERMAKGGIDFDTAWARLKKGRTYTRASTGRRVERQLVDGTAFENTIEIPEQYDPSRRWAVRVQLHGGIGRPDPQDPQRPRPNRIAGEPQIYLFPQGWADAAWWNANQVDNILALVDRVKRTYNVDESHVYLTGISDGGTGVYYLAMREPTPWSACLPLIGSIRVLANPRVGADGDLFVGNLVNHPFFIVNGGRDPLYPASFVAPSIDLMQRAGVPLVFHPQPDAGHDTSWWPDEQQAFEQFVRDHPRNPYPERLTWETERTDRYNRIRWLVIEALGKTPDDAAPEDANSLDSGSEEPREPLFVHRRPSGRVDIVRRGNTIEARTRGVRGFTLLLSPDVFDFSAPIVVRVNGRNNLERRVAKDVSTLLKWAARDNDRTMLFAAELKITVS